jgi:hypothetical protein
MLEPMRRATQPPDDGAAPGPAWLAVVSAALMLAPLPLGVGALALMPGQREDGPFGSAAQIFVEVAHTPSGCCSRRWCPPWVRRWWSSSARGEGRFRPLPARWRGCLSR